MPNHFFQFKQFIVRQDSCAMKVCTDACVLGAFVADTINKEAWSIHRILDIGTGTGLLSLQLAQKTTAIIDAIEIDKPAYDQAKQNFLNSPWKNRLTVVNEDALQFDAGKQYDLVIANPPFYEDSLRSVNEKKNAAKHDTTLTLEKLLEVIQKNLSITGKAAVLLPFYRLGYFEKMATTNGLFLTKKLLLRHTETHPYFRGILIFSRIKKEAVTAEMIFKKEDGKYSKEFNELLKDYYLYL